jgi:hypothetical protein
MAVLKYWDGSAWTPVAPTLPPVGLAGGDLAGSYPNPTVKANLIGRIIDTQRIAGQAEAYKTITSGSNFTVNAAATIPFGFTYTPPVDAWWEVSATISTLYKVDAVYNIGQPYMLLSPVDADGQSQTYNYETQHSSVQTFTARVITRLWRLTAGTPYTVVVRFLADGGSWQFYQGAGQMHAYAKAWAR